MIYVIGAGVEGQEGFSKRSLDVIAATDLMMGSERLLDLFPDFKGEKMVINHNLSGMVERLNKVDGDVVVLASGDPLFFGVGRYLMRNLSSKKLEFIPNVTSVQFAFAKIKEPWDDSIFVSVHGRGIPEAVDRILANDKAAVLTDEKNTPEKIAQEMIKRGRDGYDAWLCENLGASDEQITKTDVKGLLKIEASPLNVLILIKRYETNDEVPLPLFGIPDDKFAHARKLITKEEVRVLTLAKLRLHPGLIFWDIGAGSGSVSIEADRLMSEGKVYSVERNQECVDHIKKNMASFSARNMVLIEEEAPNGLEDIPDPDRVFIGGSGGNLWQILETVDRRLKPDGIIVLNSITLDTMTAATEFFDNAGYHVEISTVNIARTKPLSDYKMFEALNPVSIMTAIKE